MKKMITLAAGMLAMVALTGAAQAFTLDLSGSGAGTYTNIDHIVLSGQSVVTQNLSNPLLGIQKNDTFSESGLFTLSGYYKTGDLTDEQSFSLGSNKLYIDITNITGKVTTAPNPGFDYMANPGSGTIQMFIGPNIHTNGSSTLLTDMTLINPSGGHNNNLYLGGRSPNGTSDLTGLLSNTSVVDEILAFADLQNTLVGETKGASALTLTFSSTGQLAAPAAVPEPGTMVLLGAGLFGLAISARRKKA